VEGGKFVVVSQFVHCTAAEVPIEQASDMDAQTTDPASDESVAAAQSFATFAGCLRKIVIVVSLLPALSGAVVLLGCAFNIESLQIVSAGEAFAFLIAGIALFLLSMRRQTNVIVPITLCLAIVLLFIGFPTAAQYIFHSDFQIDRLHTYPDGLSKGIQHTQMSFQCAISLIVIACSIGAMNSSRARVHKFVQLFAVAVALCAAAALIGHVFGFGFLTRIVYDTQLSLPSACALILLATAIFLSRASYGPASLLASDTVGGTVARRMLPLSFLSLPLVGLLHAFWPGADLFILVMTVSCLLPLMIWMAASLLAKVELEKRAAYDELQLLHQQANTHAAELLLSYNQVNEALHARSEFLAKVSHELRTPLSGIISTTEMLVESNLSNEQLQLANISLESGGTLLKLINDILDFSKLEAHKLELEAVDLDLFKVVDSAVETLKAKAARKGLSLLTYVGANVPRMIKGDPGRIRQVLINLLDNAIKFTEQGRILLQLTVTSKNDLHFIVRDTGIGIPEQFTDRLFQPFVQADGSMTRRYGGSGLGLSICKSLIEVMGGQIGIKSAIGQGSDFWFSVPLVVSGSKIPCDTGVVRQDITATTKPKLILVVEDNPVNAKIATLQLNKLGYRVDVAVNGKEAIETASKKDYDLIFMDIQMPEMDGLQATKMIRLNEIATKKHVPIVALTAHAMESDREKCLFAGMDDYLSKPPPLNKISAILNQWIPIESKNDDRLAELRASISQRLHAQPAETVALGQ